VAEKASKTQLEEVKLIYQLVFRIVLEEVRIICQLVLKIVLEKAIIVKFRAQGSLLLVTKENLQVK
jgi:hypothetical protein